MSTDPDRIRILCVDDHPVVREGIAGLVTVQPDMVLVAEAANGREAIYRSVSAFAPICVPTRCPWGEKAFTRYLGPDRRRWADHDATALVEAGRHTGSILIDQGLADKFLAEQLHPQALEAACSNTGQPLTLRRHERYDHSYYIISTFIEDHIAHHAEARCS
jgi:S-formylglutathione hydrolase